MSNRSEYLIANIIDRIAAISETAKERDNNISYDDEAYHSSLRRHGLDPVVSSQYKEHDEEYLAAVAVDATERSHRKFNEDEALQEVHASVYLGPRERVRMAISRNYIDGNGENIYNHVLAEHQRDNPHLEGVQRLASSFAKSTSND